MQSFDVLIVGNGVIGLSCALALRLEDQNLHIGIIGPSSPCGDASSASGAMLGCFGEVTASTLKSRFGQAKFDIARQSATLWADWLQIINELSPYREKLSANLGTFVALNSASGLLDSENFQTIIKALEAYNEPYDTLNPDNIPGLHPLPNFRPLQAIFLPNEGSIHSGNLLYHLRGILKNAPNITYIDGTVDKLSFSSDNFSSLETQQGERISANQLLIAAGSSSQSLIEQIPGIKKKIPPLFYGVGCSILIEVPQRKIDYVVRTPNRSFACGLHVVPRDPQTLYIGATNNVEIAPETHPRMALLHFLMQCALEQIDQGFHNAKVISSFVGNRPVALDTFPLIGSTSVSNLKILSGTYRDGLHCSPLLARCMAKKLLNENYSHDCFDLFPPERKPIQTMTKEESIEEALKHYMAGAYEHAMKLPRVGWDEMFIQLLRQKFYALYQDLNIDFGLPPDLLLMFDGNRNKHVTHFKEMEII
jgi:glycine/D-amino acid oxidase-like deaminating enzyme